MTSTLDYEHGITAIDAGYNRPAQVAIHLLVEGQRAAFIDTGIPRSVPAALEALAASGLKPEHVDYVIVTHVHLDHAGGAGRLMQACPNARLVVHPRGARHMIDPSRLLAGVAAVYGEEEMSRNFAGVLPIPPERIIEAPDGFSLTLNGRPLLFLDTPGHARHHFCIIDERAAAAFTGDTFGLSYREFDTEHGAFIFPTTTPVQFDPAALHASIDRIAVHLPRQLFLTHYARVTDIPRLAADMHELIDAFVALAERNCSAGTARRQALIDAQAELLWPRLEAHGTRLSRAEALGILHDDLVLNAQGLEVWLDNRRTPEMVR